MNSCGPQKLDEGATYLIYGILCTLCSSHRHLKIHSLSFFTKKGKHFYKYLQRFFTYNCTLVSFVDHILCLLKAFF